VKYDLTDRDLFEEMKNWGIEKLR